MATLTFLLPKRFSIKSPSKPQGLSGCGEDCFMVREEGAWVVCIDLHIRYTANPYPIGSTLHPSYGIRRVSNKRIRDTADVHYISHAPNSGSTRK
ncbi:MAG: hypothetical protein IPO07_26775 [Haliscomenobacter sp.]|nr:hypothetical protein [Haliscomenobacter sp.]MBK9492004.1 hypothetical protein [Haliscomenobacter sp.]